MEAPHCQESSQGQTLARVLEVSGHAHALCETCNGGKKKGKEQPEWLYMFGGGFQLEMKVAVCQ